MSAVEILLAFLKIDAFGPAGLPNRHVSDRKTLPHLAILAHLNKLKLGVLYVIRARAPGNLLSFCGRFKRWIFIGNPEHSRG